MNQGQILVVSPNLPIPPGTTSKDATNPKATIKSLVMSSDQANEDSKYDPVPKRGTEPFSTDQFPPYLIYLFQLLVAFFVIYLIYIVCKKQKSYTACIVVSLMILVILARN
jgi:hypothetical protein